MAAGAAARRSVGNVPLTRHQVRDVWIWPWLQDATQDIEAMLAVQMIGVHHLATMLSLPKTSSARFG